MSTLVSTSHSNVLTPMAKTVKPLTDSQIAAAKPKDVRYTLQDGNGLMLFITPTCTKSWIYRYKNANKKQVLITLGQYPTLSLAKARKLRQEYETMRAEGKDPKEQLDIQKAKLNDAHTLENITRKWLDVYATKKPLDEYTKNKRLRKFENHLFPKFKNKAIAQISLRELKDALNIIYDHSPDNAQRIRSDLILIFGYAKQYSHIETNIARELDEMDLSTPNKKHRATFKKGELNRIPQLIQKIKSDTGHPITKLCLLIALHTFTRSSELRYARWSEFDFDSKKWNIPAKRTLVDGIKHSDRGAKMRIPHIVPLSAQVIELLQQVKVYSGNSDFVFPSPNNKGNFLSENTPNDALKRMGYNQDELCLHGFRALARSSIGEMSLFSKEALERQMSHKEPDSTVDAYTHIAEYMEERTQMMHVWSEWLAVVEYGEYITPFHYSKQIKQTLHK